MYTKAIVCPPTASIVQGITDHPELGEPNYKKALEQHKAYVAALEQCGLEVTVLPPDPMHPDSCFVEDVAVLCPEFAVITNPSSISRKGEVSAITSTVNELYSSDKTLTMTAPATLEGGDVIRCDKTFFIGLSTRTNEQGVEQFTSFAQKFGYKVVVIPVSCNTHLKTYVTYLQNNTMLLGGEFTERLDFNSFTLIKMQDSDEYAANCLWINGKVIVPKGYAKALTEITNAGYETIICDTSEFKKVDGSLTCLSLLI